MINIKQAFRAYCHDIAQTYEKSKKYITTEHKVLTGLAVGAISIVSAGIATRWAYGALVDKFTKKDGIFESHEKAANKTVNEINAQFQKVSESFARKIKDIRGLGLIGAEITHLHINIPELTDADLEKLDLKKIKFLNLAGCKKISDAALEKISTCTNLETLILAGADQITDKGFAQLAKLENLTKLNIACCDGVTDKGLKHLKEFKSRDKLIELDVSGCPGITDDSIPNINLLDNLEVPNIEGTNIKKFEFAQLKCLKNLKEVLLESSQVSRGIPECLKDKQPTARNLTLDASITDEDLVYLKDYNQLEVLDLSNCGQITNKGLNYLTGLRNLKTLILSSGGDFDNECIGILQKNQSLEEVKFVDSESKEIEGHVSVVDTFESLKAKEKRLLLASTQSRLELLYNDQRVENAPKIIENSEKVELKQEKKKPEREPETVQSVKKQENLSQPITTLLPSSFGNVTSDATTLKLTALATDGDLQFLIGFKNLKSLDLSACTNLTGKGLGILGKLTQLESLSLEKCKQFSSEVIENAIGPLVNLKVLKLGWTQIANLDCIKKFKKLKQLHLQACNGISDKALVSIENLTQLTSLRLSDCTNISNTSLNTISQLSNLIELYLDRTNISDKEDLYELSILSNLEKLSLSHTKISTEFLEQLTVLKKLKVIFLNGINISKKMLLQLRKCKSLVVEYEDEKQSRLKLNYLTSDKDLELLKSFQKTEMVVLSNCEKINKFDFKKLNDVKNLRSVLIENYIDFPQEYLDGISHVEKLSRLFIENTKVSDRHLESLKGIKKLELLSITGEGVSDDGLKILSEMAHLKMLKLNGSKITYEGLVALSKNKSLEKVVIENCQSITEEQKVQLKKLFKNITI